MIRKRRFILAEGKFTDALKTSEKAIAILTKSENMSYLVESFSTKTKTLIYLNDFSAATFCLLEAVQIAKNQISEEAAKNLVNEYEITLQEKNSAVIEEIFSEKKRRNCPKKLSNWFCRPQLLTIRIFKASG